MRYYRRVYAPGACYFFTVNLAHRRGNDLLVRYVEALRESVATIRRRHPFAIDAMVVLPDHLHSLWVLPRGDADFSTRWRLIKARCTRALQPSATANPSRMRRGERDIWQRRFWEHVIRDARDWRNHMDYIHDNPVKHGLVANAVDWPYSSFHHHVRASRYEPSWGASQAVREMDLD